jgi:hypothetical protein
MLLALFLLFLLFRRNGQSVIVLHKLEAAVTLHERIVRNVLQKRKINQRHSTNTEGIWAPLRPTTRRAWGQPDPGEYCSHDSACHQLTPAVYMATKQGAEHVE